jgi:trigger factor
MNVKSKVENKELFSVELVIEVGAEEFEAGLDRAYKKNRGSISVPGFRKGKAPRKVIEGMYGIGVFYEDAIEELYPVALEEAVRSEELDIVATPAVEIVEAGKDGVTFKATITVRPEVTLENYKGLEADKVLATVSDAAVDAELGTLVERATRLEAVERAAENGDTAVIDFEGFQEGIPFQGGKGENFELVLGSGSFIPGFEDQVVGMSAGEEREVTVTFPEDYQAAELAGKPAVFKVKLHEVKGKAVPELDDEFAKDVSEFDTLTALKEDLRAKVAERNMAQADARFKQALLDQLADQVTIELPAAMVEAQIDNVMNDYKQRLESQGISLEMYMSYMQLTEQAMRTELRPGAERQLKTQLALEAIAKAEQIQVADEDVTEEFKKIAASVQLTVEEVEAALSRSSFKRDMARDRALDVVVQSAKANLVAEEDLKVEEVTAEESDKEKKTAAKKSKEAPAEGPEAAPAKKTRAKKATAKAEEGEAAPSKPAKKAKAEQTEE